MEDLEQQVARDVLNTFSKHIVAPCVHYRVVDADGEPADPLELRAYSGVVVELYGDWFFLGAGHCIRNLKDVIDTTGIVVDTVLLVDSFTLEAGREEPILFDLDDPAWIHVVDKDDGLDFALLRLDERYVQLLKDQGIEPLPTSGWADFDRQEFDHYYIVGLPAERQMFDPNDQHGSVALTLLRIDPAAAPPDDERTYPGLYGQIDMDVFTLERLEGMSGGPIFGVILGTRPEYRLAAVQSEWWEDTGLVFGCRIDVIKGLLEKWVEDSLKREADST